MTVRRRPTKAEKSRPYRVRLPGFVRDEDIGLGDFIKQVTRAAGVRPCGGCSKRAETLNRWVTVAGRRAR
jgi:hypothetical protein